MSYITAKLNVVIRSKLSLSRSIATKSLNYYYTTNSKVFTLDSNYRMSVVEFPTQIQTYATIASKIDESRIPKILKELAFNKVSLQFDNFAKIRPSLFKNYSISVENGFSILKSCSQLVDRSAKERISLVNDAWNELIKMCETPNKDHLILLLQAYRRAGLKSVENYQSFFEKYNCPIDIYIYAELMYIMCKNGDTMENAEALLKEIEAHDDIQLNDKIYNALILGYSKQGIDAVENVLKTMKSKKITPTLDTQTELIKAYISNGHDDTAMELLQQYQDYNTDQLYDIIRAAANNNNEAIVVKALSLLSPAIQNAQLIERNIQNICMELIHSNRSRSPNAKLDPYQLIIRHLPAPKQQMGDTSEYGTFLIKEMIVTNENVANILQFCENLIESERNLYSIRACCMYSFIFNLKNARDFLKALAARETLRPHYFWPLLCHANNQDDVIDIIKFASDLNVVLDKTTLLKYVLSKSNTLINSQATVQALIDAGVRMYDLKTASIAFLLSKQRPKEALDIASRSAAQIDPFIVQPAISYFVRSKYYEKNAKTISILIKKLQGRCRDKQYDLAGEVILSICTKSDQYKEFAKTQELLTDFKRYEVKFSATAANEILCRMRKNRKILEKFCPVVQDLILNNTRFPDTSSTPDTPKTESQIETLHNQLIEFKENGLPTHGILYRLFIKHVQYGQHARAIEIKKECDKVGVAETPVMLSTLIKLWTALSMHDEALNVLTILQRKYPEFHVDVYKIIDLATLMLSKNRLEDGKKLINQLPTCKQKSSDSYLSNNIWHLLVAAIEHSVNHNKEENIAGQFLESLATKGYCEYSNPLLGCVINEFIQKKQIHEALAAFEHFATEYRRTPQFVTFLTLLIEISNGENNEFNISEENAVEYLQRVIALGQQIHGTENSNCNLILAFASAGKDQQLRKILMDPKVKFNSKTLMNNLIFLKDRLQIKVDVTIARRVRGLYHTSLSEENLWIALFARMTLIRLLICITRYNKTRKVLFQRCSSERL